MSWPGKKKNTIRFPAQNKAFQGNLIQNANVSEGKNCFAWFSALSTQAQGILSACFWQLSSGRRTCVTLHTHTCMHTYRHTHTYMHTSRHTRTYMHTSRHTHTYMHTSRHTHTYMHTSRHTHTYMHTSRSRQADLGAWQNLA